MHAFCCCFPGAQMAPTTLLPPATSLWSWCASRRQQRWPQHAGGSHRQASLSAHRVFGAPPPSPTQAWPHQQHTCCRLGKGDKNAADQAAVDMMRKVLNDISMDGVVVIGEGEKDEAPMLYCGASASLGRKCGWVLTASQHLTAPRGPYCLPCECFSGWPVWLGLDSIAASEPRDLYCLPQ